MKTEFLTLEQIQVTKFILKARVIEIYYSISGEGISTGLPTVLVRFSGCSLRCGQIDGKKLWCDSPFALNPNLGELLSVSQVLQKIKNLTNLPVQVLLTGGEPLEGEKRDFSIEIAKKISQMRHKKNYALIRMETNGKESISGMDCMVFSLDYKLPGSGMEKFMNLDNFEVLKIRKNPLDEVKFVVRDYEDFQRSQAIIKKFKLNTNILYSPVTGECSPIELSEWIKSNPHPNSRLSLQIHKYIWGNKRGV